MYKIDRRSNSIEKVDKKTFSELGFKERQNLQEWIAKEPTCLGEELLIIQKEFDGFDDTRERLDLLALYKSGSSLFANISPSKEHWISAGSGMRACPFTFVFSKKYGRVELYIDRGEQDENEFIFNELLKYKSDI